MYSDYLAWLQPCEQELLNSIAVKSVKSGNTVYSVRYGQQNSNPLSIQ